MLCYPSNLFVFIIIVVIAGSQTYKVLGFEGRFTSKRDQQHFPDDAAAYSAPPTVQNPITQRKIQLGGPTFNNFLKQGCWVQHEGTLKRLDLAALRDYQRGISIRVKDDGAASSQTKSDLTLEEKDEWYSITPSVLVSQHEKRPLNQDEMNLLREELLFVNKPSGLHCVPSRDLSVDSLYSQIRSSLLQHQQKDPKPCHRLDRDTSGIVLFGLTVDAHREASKQFESRTTLKTYTALVAGHPAQDHGIIDLPIGKMKTKEGFSRWMIGGEKQREAITEWRIDETFMDADTGAKFSRVELIPKTGRGHQLRLHMKAMGCPILGDTLHGEGGVVACSPRLCLHALKLQVDWHGLRLQAESVAPF